MPLFDGHLHIIDPRFPMVPNQGYLPPAFTCEDYRQRMQAHQLLGGAVVSGSFQGYDQSYLIEALNVLGPHFVGVTQLPGNAPNQQILNLDRQGVRGLRFNLRRGGHRALGDMREMASRVYDLCGWHVELYVDSTELGALHQWLVTLPAVCIDHLGLSRRGFSDLLKLAECGVRIKASGFGRVDLDVRHALKTLHLANPSALMFGSDLPSTRAQRVFQDADIDLVADTLGEEAAQRVLWRNGAEFYRVDI